MTTTIKLIDEIESMKREHKNEWFVFFILMGTLGLMILSIGQYTGDIVFSSFDYTNFLFSLSLVISIFFIVFGTYKLEEMKNGKQIK